MTSGLEWTTLILGPGLPRKAEREQPDRRRRGTQFEDSRAWEENPQTENVWEENPQTENIWEENSRTQNPQPGLRVWG